MRLFFAEKIASKLFKISWIKKVILGTKYIEGHWLLTTLSLENDLGSPLLNTGIAYMYFDEDSQEFCVRTTRIEDGQVFITMSEVAHIRTTGPNLRYLNFFKLSGMKYENRKGFSHGRFAKTSAFSRKPYSFEADISVQGEAVTRRQFASRIPDKEALKYYHEYGEQWIRHYLEKMHFASKQETEEMQVEALQEMHGSEGAETKNHIELIKSMWKASKKDPV